MEEKKETEKGSFDESHCRLENGMYIYTNPQTKQELFFNSTLSKWIPLTVTQNPNVTFDGTSYTYTDPTDSTLYEWDTEKSAWFPKLNEEFMVRYQLSYGEDESDKNKNSESSVPSATQLESDKNNQLDSGNPSTSKPDKNAVKRKKEDEWFELSETENTKVYVSGLPEDITEAEFVEFMSKCGLILKDINSGEPKIKLYTDSSGNKKGDGLCSYIKKESVDLALNILDESELRGKIIRVERAKFQLKGAYDPTKKPKSSRKRKEKEKLKKAQEKLFEWKPEKLRGERGKHERIVVVKNAFSPDDFNSDATLILEYQDDFKAEASKCGTCKKVVIFDRHPEGVLQIFMTNPVEADKVVLLFNNRFFGGKQISAFNWDGHTRYKVEETETEKAERLKKWEEFISKDDN